MSGRDITEGRSTRAIAVELGIATSNIWQNTGDAYDVAIAGEPFLIAINDQRPYERATAPFRKQQFDSQRDPGEQSLSGWWLRSQSSFHAGEGITYYDPLANPYSTTIASNSYRIKSAYGVDIWEPGQATLLREVSQGHVVTKEIDSTTKRSNQTMRSVQWKNNSTTINGVLFHDGYDIDRIHEDGTTDHWVDYTPGVTDKVFAMTDDSNYAYWVTNDTVSGKLDVRKKSIAATSGASSASMFTSPGLTVTNAVIEYVKQRLVMAVNNKIYEFPVTQATMPTEVYTNPSSSFIYTSITEAGPAIYVAGYEGIQSTIVKFTLSTSGAMPTLSGGAITAAEMPVGEIVHKIYQYLGLMMIGTNKGVRIANISADGSLTYGPLITETVHPCYDFAARDRFVWCATGVQALDNPAPGVIRIDLSNEIDNLRFAYAKDNYYDTTTHSETTACAFIGETDRLMFSSAATQMDGTITNKALTSNVATLTTSGNHGLVVGDVVWIEGVGSPFDTGSPYTGDTVLSVPTSTTFTYSRSTSNVTSAAVTSTSAVVKTIGHVYTEHATNKRTSGYIETGYIRYNTLEPKNFKRISAKADVGVPPGRFTTAVTKGSISIATVDLDGNVYDVVSYDNVIGTPESTITNPSGAQDAIGLRFTLYRDADDATKTPVLKGYQLKAVPATPRERIIKIPLLNFDTETDRYNTTQGWEGRAYARLAKLESIEALGDVVTFQDFRTNEIKQCLIEEVSFISNTPPDKKLTNFGGVITLTIRTV